MIIYQYDNDKEEYDEEAHIYPDGNIDGNTDLADSFRDMFSDGGIEHPDGTKVNEGLKLMLIIEHRYNNGYHMAAWEDKDGEMLYDRLEGEDDGE